MKKIYKNLILIFFATLMQIHLIAQVNCNDMVYISLNPWDGTADIEADWFVQGGDQYDQLLIDVNQVDCDDIGTPVIVNITAIMGSDTSSCESMAIVEDKTPPVVVVTTGLEILLDENGEANITPEVIDNGTWDNCDGVTMSVSPSSFTCADLWEEVTVTLTAEDESGNTNTAWTTVIVTQDNGAIACNADVSVNVDDGPVLLEVDDILFSVQHEGCSENLQLVLTDAAGQVVPDNIVSSSYAGTDLYATISNTLGNSCFTLVTVNGEVDCEDFTEDNITWPNDISIAILGVDTDSLSPASLIEFYEVDPSDAMPTIINYDCEQNIAMTYSDQIITIDNFSFKVVRTWTIFDWISSNDFTHNQIIDNFPITDFICDTLPRTAPVGDCDSGHTPDDDVEWPGDLYIEDYRITPEELIMYSGVDPLDSSPSFYNEPDEYSAEYVDYLIELQPEELTLGREWTVTRDDAPGAYWVYLQTIVVNLAGFNNLVTVETITNRPVPDVEVTQGTITDELGQATVDPDDLVNPWLEDDPQNGLDILDLFIMRQSILGIEYMNDLQNIAADVNESEAVTTLDLVLVERVILGIDTELSSNWWFLDKPADANLSPKAQYIAVKPGDVNDSAILGANNFGGESGLKFKDQLVNEGEIIKVPFFVSEDVEMHGAELSFTLDTDAFEVDAILSPYFANSVQYNVTDEGKLNLILMNKDLSDLEQITTDQALFQITLTAKENTVLSWALSLNENRESFYLDANTERILFNEVVDGEIISGTQNLEELGGVNVYPNPASAILKISSSHELNLEDFVMTLTNQAGKLMLVNKGNLEIDISNLSSGMYFYTIAQGNKLAKGKIVIAN